MSGDNPTTTTKPNTDPKAFKLGTSFMTPARWEAVQRMVAKAKPVSVSSSEALPRTIYIEI